MFIKDPIVGKHVIMRSVDENDSEFILKLRLDDYIKQFIGLTENNVAKQIEWIKQQRLRNGDYYFIYTDLKGQALGVISVYNIRNNYGETGRQMSLGGSIHNMEAEYMMMCFAFEVLKLDKVISTIYTTNKRAISKARKLGIIFDKIIKVNGIESYYVETTLMDFQKIWKPKMLSFLFKVENLDL